MIGVIIYDDPFEDPVEKARVTIEGEVIGNSHTVEVLQSRLESERDPMGQCTDGRELLRFVMGSYSNGYVLAGYANKESKRIVQDLSDEEYEQWKASTEYDTSL